MRFCPRCKHIYIDDSLQSCLYDGTALVTKVSSEPLLGVEAKLLPKEEVAFEYMAESVLRAESRIDHAALAPPIQRIQAPSRKWEDSIEKVLKSNKVTYCYVALLTDRARRKRVEQHLSNPQIEHYFVKYYNPSESVVPTLSFILIDEREVVMHYPFEPGQDETFLAIRHPDIAKLFIAYYRTLWNQAIPLDYRNLKDVMNSLE